MLIILPTQNFILVQVLLFLPKNQSQTQLLNLSEIQQY